MKAIWENINQMAMTTNAADNNALYGELILYALQTDMEIWTILSMLRMHFTAP